MTIHTARVQFSSDDIAVILPGLGETVGDDQVALHLSISCQPLDWQLSALAQVLDSFSSSLQTVESLEIEVHHEDRQGEIEVIQWRELLHPFTSVKHVTFDESAQLIAPALQELTGESATEVLPALQDLSLTTSWPPSGPVKEGIEQFTAARQLHGHPVTVHYLDTKLRGTCVGRSVIVPTRLMLRDIYLSPLSLAIFSTPEVPTTILLLLPCHLISLYEIFGPCRQYIL